MGTRLSSQLDGEAVSEPAERSSRLKPQVLATHRDIGPANLLAKACLTGPVPSETHTPRIASERKRELCARDAHAQESLPAPLATLVTSRLAAINTSSAPAAPSTGQSKRSSQDAAGARN